VAATGHSIRVGQLLTAMRHADRGMEIAELAVRHRDRGVVGFDFAGAEAGFPPSKARGAFDYLAHNFLPVTVHAGEADGLDSIRSALFDGRALRLGHGVRVAEDILIESDDGENTYVSLGELSQWVKDREIALETSPSSNLQTGAIAQWGTEMIDHPFDLLYQLGFRVTVNTDNRLMSNTTLSRELQLLTEAFGYDLADLEMFQLNAAAAAFLPLEDREDLAEQITVGFAEA
ncbi:MAG: adenosine deaminase, partial [Microbacteriaceae bacterium]